MRRNFVLGSVTLVLVFGALSHLLVSSSLRSTLRDSLDARLGEDAALLDDSLRLDALSLVEEVRDRAATSALAAVFAANDEATRRGRAYDAATKVSEWLRDSSRRGSRPDVVLIVDDSGRVVARDADPNRMVGDRLDGTLSILNGVLAEGRAASDVWSNAAKGLSTLRVAAAAIRDARGTIRGALIVGYGLGDGVVTRKAATLGRDVALFSGGKIIATSLPESAVRDVEKALLTEPVAARLDRLAAKDEAPRLEVTVGGAELAAIARRVPFAESEAVTAVIVERPGDAARVLSSANLLWPLTGVFALLAVVLGWIMANRVLVPVGVMEEGVLSIINGDLDHRIALDDDDDLGGLAYRINQLVSALSGEPEGGRQAPGEGWGALDRSLSNAPVERAQTPPSADPMDDPELGEALASEPEDQYLARVFREYAEAKRAAGEDLGPISQEKFGARLLASARSMSEKHGRPVRFRVEQVGGWVLLRPVLLPERVA